MPKATVTVRELKNKDTGIDLSVTSYREITGLVRSTFEYQIVVVTNLSVFKLPSHKDTDTVQFTLFKKFPDFEDLRNKLNEVFSGMAMPQLVKKSIIVNEAVVKERRNSLDSFLKFICATPRIVISRHVLTFLGVDEQKAKRFVSGELDDTPTQENDAEDKTEREEASIEKSPSSLFEDEDEAEDEGTNFVEAGSKSAAAADNDDDDDFFSTAVTKSSAASARLFESQDLKRELTEEDEKDFAFIPDAIITKQEVITGAADDDETSDLLNVDEDIDLEKLLISKSGGQPDAASELSDLSSNLLFSDKPQPTSREKPAAPSKPQISPKPIIPTTTTGSTKPAVPAKPAPDSLGSSPEKVKPVVPVPAKRKPVSTGSTPDKPKPTVAAKPKPAPRNTPSEKINQGDDRASEIKKKDMTSDDIMQYIAANAPDNDYDDDLFS